ncbi:echinoidin-like [Asterias rubens]|uniref:echinoidin-like n=1 Tax=Asterias rubens TaxID=7604 RepID=UPI00145543D9|nr:echinoidin-like [Asterias rubens]
MESKAVLICLVLCAVFCGSNAGCPAYWTQNGNSCYRFIGLPQTYARADSVCKMFAGCGESGRGIGHLISLNTPMENQFAFGLLANVFGEIPPAQAWLGLSDMNPNQEFMWSDGTRPTYKAWGPNSPSQSHNSNCAIFGELLAPRWMDVMCEEEFPYICEMPARSEFTCPEGAGPAAAPVPVILKNPNEPRVVRYPDGLPKPQH